MHALIPDHLERPYRERIQGASPSTEVSLLHIERHRPLHLRLASAAARRWAPYHLYQRIASAAESAGSLTLRMDGAVLVRPRPGIEVFLATAAVDRRIVATVVALLPDLRWVHSTPTGVDRFDLRLLKDRNITLTASRGVHARRIAEFVMGLIYADAKRLCAHLEQTRRRRPARLHSAELSGLCVGIVGFGSIGREVASLARANGLSVVAFARNEGGQHTGDGIRATPRLEDVLTASDIVVVALPLTPETRGLLGWGELKLMRSHAMLINVGRAQTIVLDDLLLALRQRVIRRACLDLVEGDGRSRHHPVYECEGVVYTSHSASASQTADEAVVEYFAENIRRYQQGQPLEGLIDLSRGY
jgi:phosphoglycerate dehydrogenase-like enzyme